MSVADQSHLSYIGRIEDFEVNVATSNPEGERCAHILETCRVCDEEVHRKTRLASAARSPVPTTIIGR